MAGRRTTPSAKPDLFIAATAAVHSLRVVTSNVSDFVPAAEVPVFNPWSGTLPIEAGGDSAPADEGDRGTAHPNPLTIQGDKVGYQ